MFDDGFDLDDVIKAAALVALAGGAVKGFNKFVPVSGIATRKMLKESEALQAIRKLARENVRIAHGFKDTPGERTAVAEQMMLLAENGNMGEFAMLQPEITRSSWRNVDGTFRTAPERDQNFEFISPSDDVSPKDYLPLDRAVNKSTGEIITTDNPRRDLSLARENIEKEAGTFARAAGFRRLGRSLRNASLRNASLPEDQPKKLSNKAGGVVSNWDMNSTGVQPPLPGFGLRNVDYMADNLSQAAERNRLLYALYEAFARQEAAGGGARGQLKFLRDTRKASKFREELVNETLQPYVTALREMQKQTGNPLSEKAAEERVIKAFADVTGNTNTAGALSRLDKAFNMVSADNPFSDNVMAEALDVIKRTPAGRTDEMFPDNIPLNKAADALGGYRVKPLGTGKSAVTSKTNLLDDVLAGRIDSSVVDSAEIDRLIGLLASDAVEHKKIQDAIFANPELYSLLVEANNNALNSDMLRKVSWALRPKRTGVSGLQSGLQGRV